MVFRTAAVCACALAALATPPPASSQARVSPAPAYRAPPADSTLYASAREGFSPQSLSDMATYFRVVFPDFYETYFRDNRLFSLGLEVPGLDAMYREPYTRWGSPGYLLLCRYRAPGDEWYREYYFWHERAPDSAQPEVLRKLHRNHALLLIGAPRARCAETEREAYDDVLRNFVQGVRFADAVSAQPDLLQPPDEMLPVSWDTVDDAAESGRQFVGGDPAGLPYPRLDWITDEVEWYRLWVRSAQAFGSYCIDEQTPPQSRESNAKLAAADPADMPPELVESWRRNVAAGNADLRVWAVLAFCDFPAYLEELDRYNERVLSELDP
jgi:hypothetical protein